MVNNESKKIHEGEVINAGEKFLDKRMKDRALKGDKLEQKKTKEGKVLKLKKANEDTTGTNWAGNQASNAGAGVPIQAMKQPLPKKPEPKIDPEDEVELGGITPVIFNPTMKDSENKTDTKDINLVKAGNATTNKRMNEMVVQRVLNHRKKINEDDLANLATAVIGGAIGYGIHRYRKNKANASKTRARKPNEPEAKQMHRWGGDTRADQLGINALKRHWEKRKALGPASFPGKQQSPQQSAPQQQSTLKTVNGPWGPRVGTNATGPKVSYTRKPNKFDKERQERADTAHDDLIKLRSNIAQHAAERTKSFNKAEWEKKWGNPKDNIAKMQAANTPEKYHNWLQRDVPANQRKPYVSPVSSPEASVKQPTAKSNVIKMKDRMSAKDFNKVLKQNPGLKIKGRKVTEELNEAAEMIMHHNENLDSKKEAETFDNWLRKRKGVPKGHVYVHHHPHHFIFRGKLEDVENEFKESHGEKTKLAPHPKGGKNEYVLEQRNIEIVRRVLDEAKGLMYKGLSQKGKEKMAKKLKKYETKSAQKRMRDRADSFRFE